MKGINLKKAANSLKRASPILLTVIGAAGMVATVVMAVKVTPKAIEAIQMDSRHNHEGKSFAATKSEAVKSCWKMYVPAAITGVASLVCLFGATALSSRQQANLASAYALLNRSFKDYQRKVFELDNGETHKKILEALAVEKAEKTHITTEVFASTACLDFEDANEEEHLFYDAFSERYFQATISQVLNAEYHLNRNFALGGEIGVNEFYKFLGLEPIKKFNNLGWLMTDDIIWIDFDHSRAKVDDGLNGEVDCYVIYMALEPTTADALD